MNYHIERAARDRLIDLVAMGKTYPLTDLELASEALKVAINQPAKIAIELSQHPVRYQLHDVENNTVADVNGLFFEALGNGEQALLNTPVITEQVSYKIWANKILSNGVVDPHYGVYLGQWARISVGLNTQLTARIINAPLLVNNTRPNPEDTAPRIVSYNQSANVQIDNSQEGVSYQLFADKGESTPAISNPVIGLGTGQSILLSSNSLLEDTEISIKIIKLSVTANEVEEAGWLQITLPIKVRANTMLMVAAQNSAIIDFGASAKIQLNESQSNVFYKVYSHRISDEEFLYLESRDDSRLAAVVPGFADVQVAQPVNTGSSGRVVTGYDESSEWQQGNGGQLIIPLGNVEYDTTLIVMAEKRHRVKPDLTVNSHDQLNQACIVLCKPNPDIALDFNITAPIVNSPMMRVSNGQAGVFYHFRLRSNSREISLPAYFHHHAQARVESKGVDSLRLEVDFAIDNNEMDDATLLSLVNIPQGSFHITARRAMSNVSTVLTARVPIAALTEFEQSIETNNTFKVVINNSLIGARYQLLEDEQLSTNAQNGNGNTLTLNTISTDFEVHFALRTTHSLVNGAVFEIEQPFDVNDGQR